VRPVDASPGFVPHEAWDKFAWLVPHEPREEPWYYAVPTGQRPQLRQLPSDPAFMRSVDPEIRPLVAWLHRQGVPTGPSCSGHDVDKRGFDDIYAGLERDAEEIRTIGVLLRDPEDGNDYVAMDEDYEFPWSSFEEFLAQAREHQPVGWLPFYTTDPRVKLALGSGPGFEIKKTDEDAYGIRTDGTDPEAWTKAAAVLGRALS
jgi:hypothetical protein